MTQSCDLLTIRLQGSGDFIALLGPHTVDLLGIHDMAHAWLVAMALQVTVIACLLPRCRTVLAPIDTVVNLGNESSSSQNTLAFPNTLVDCAHGKLLIRLVLDSGILRFLLI